MGGSYQSGKRWIRMAYEVILGVSGSLCSFIFYIFSMLFQYFNRKGENKIGILFDAFRKIIINDLVIILSFIYGGFDRVAF